MKTTAVIVATFVLLLSGAFPVQAGVKNPDTFILATYGTLHTLDIDKRQGLEIG